MTQPPYPPPLYRQEPLPALARNGLGTAGFVVGLLGLIFSFIPIIGVVAWPLVIIGLVFSAVGISLAIRKKATNKGLAIAGLVLSLLGLGVCVLWVAGATRIATVVNNRVNHTADVHYEVDGTAPSPTITYSTFGDNGSATNRENASILPWSKDIQVRGLFKGGSLVINTGAEGGSVTCLVLVDGKETKTATASGQFATASCGF